MRTGAGVCEHDHRADGVIALPATASLVAAAGMYRALGDPLRLRLLVRLAAGELCVTELAEQENEKISTISARLKMLHAVRLVRSRREAKHIFYSVNDDHVLDLIQSALDHATEPKIAALEEEPR